MSGNNGPNILLVMSDQHNPHILGCEGDPVVMTPNIDKIAESGIRFSSLYCPSPLCVPSRMGFLTGQYPSDVGIYRNPSVLSSQIPTFVHGMRQAGYETALCGRMHFAKGSDQLHGFEKRLYGDCFDFVTQPLRGGGFHKTTGQTRYAAEIAGYGNSGYTRYDEEVAERACSFLGSRSTDHPPFLMVVGYIQPHNPLVCGRELFEHYMEELPVPDSPPEGYLNALHPAIRLWRERRRVDELSVDQRRRARAAYFGLVTQTDREVGKVLDCLRTSGLEDDTIVIYTSDHGDMCDEQHGMWWKSNYFEGSARVPFLVSFPKAFHRGKTVDIVASLIDVGPTLLDITGCEPLPDAAGRSFASYLIDEQRDSRAVKSRNAADSDASWRNEVYSEFAGAWGDKPSCMIRSGPWKLMYYSEMDSSLLFNLVEDPGETVDRSDDPSCREVVGDLSAKVKKRWSAERILMDSEKDAKRTGYIKASGGSICPMPFDHPKPAEEANVFDFDQVPNWPDLKPKAEAEWAALPDMEE